MYYHSWAHLDLVCRFHSQTVVTAGDAIIPTCLPETHDVVLRAWPQGGTSVCPSHYEIGYLSHRLHSIVSRGTSLSQPVAYNLLYTGRREEEDTQGTVTRTDQIRNAHFVHTFQNAHPHIHTYWYIYTMIHACVYIYMYMYINVHLMCCTCTCIYTSRGFLCCLLPSSSLVGLRYGMKAPLLPIEPTRECGV